MPLNSVQNGSLLGSPSRVASQIAFQLLFQEEFSVYSGKLGEYRQFGFQTLATPLLEGLH